MTTVRTRLTAEQKIAALNAKIKAIKEAERNAKKSKKEITRESSGIEALINAIEATAKANKVKKPVIIRALAKLTRSGLKFVD